MFEDGWYLGRQMLKEGDIGESGLFPEGKKEQEGAKL